MTNPATTTPPAEQIKDLDALFSRLNDTLAQGTKANAEKIALLEGLINQQRTDFNAAQRSTDNRADVNLGYKPTGNPEKDFSWLRFMRGVAENWSEDSGTRKFPEFERTMETRKKAQQAGQDSLGGFLVAPEIFVDQIIPALEPRVAILNAGAMMVTDLVGSPVEWPRFDDYLSGYWVGEREKPTEGNVTDSQLSMEPHGLATLVEITNRLLRQTSGRVETYLRGALGRGLARTLDKAVFKGAGGKQPVGILSQGSSTVDAGSGYTMSSGASQEVSSFLEDMIGKLEDADALFGKPVWFMHPHTRRWFQKFRDSTGRPLFFEQNAGVTASTTRTGTTFYGYPYSTTTNLIGNNSDADLVFANVEEVIIGQWGPLEVGKDTSLGFKEGTVWLRAGMEVDVGLKHDKSLSSALNLDTTVDP